MSLVSYALTTVARFKLYAGISGSSEDSKIESLINSVTDYIERRTNRRFKKTSYTEKYDGEDSKILILRQFPVFSSPAVQLYERDTYVNEDEWDVIDTEDYYVDNEEGIITATFSFVEGKQNYKVVYTAGYDIDTSNKTLELVGLSDLELVVWELVKTFLKKSKSDNTIRQIRLGDRSIAYDKIISEDDNLSLMLEKFIKYE